MPAHARAEREDQPPIRLADADVIPLELSVFNPWEPHAFPNPFDAAITRVWIAPRTGVALPCPARLQPSHDRWRWRVRGPDGRR